MPLITAHTYEIHPGWVITNYSKQTHQANNTQILLDDRPASTDHELHTKGGAKSAIYDCLGSTFIVQTHRRIYRVAQNKIPHQTICNIFATSSQILKILEAV